MNKNRKRDFLLDYFAGVKQAKKKNGLIAIVTLVIVMIVIPLLIHFFSPRVSSEITADGMLGYLGNCAAAIPTIIIASVAIWQTNKSNKIAEEANKGAIKSDEIAKRANDIAEYALKLTEDANRHTENANMLSKSSNEIAEKANETAKKALTLTEEANKKTESANNLAAEANEISSKLLELEKFRQLLELRPSFAITNWRAPVKKFQMISLHSELMSIQIGQSSDEIVWGIELELLNTSSGFETIYFNKAMDEQGNEIWSNSMTGMKTRKIELPSLETAKIYFYADREFWKQQISKKIIVDFNVKNRLDYSYKEKFEMFIMAMTDEVQCERTDEVYLYLEIQNYNVGRYVGKSIEYPDGVNWEKCELPE